ncbi:hypothetical protein BST22_18735 [Mycolicibacterium chubuense]|nr:hypothetical protein [Mycolicibacterium chubuense]ORA48220.1 hypothetical protein BST22_18735 [Mycolicibacterium chubuense]
MTLTDTVKSAATRLSVKTRDWRAARQEMSESDISPDAGVAGSRANTDGNDGSYVGRTSPQFDAEVEQSGAEARSEATRLLSGHGQ